MSARKPPNAALNHPPPTPDDAQMENNTKAGPNKGLRQFSRQVWMKVMEKKKTTYNEVADELVDEFRQEQIQSRIAQGLSPLPNTVGTNDNDGRNGGGSTANLDERNVRRRVYDALNVLMAMSIILKQKKDIIWKGLPEEDDGAPLEIGALQETLERRKSAVIQKRRQVRDLILQQLSFRRLVQRNKLAEAQARSLGLHLHDGNNGSSSSAVNGNTEDDDGGVQPLYYDAKGPDDATANNIDNEDNDGFPLQPGRPLKVIHLPFVTISTPDTATIQLDIDAPHRQEARAAFDEPFLVHDQKEILRQMRLHEFSEAELRRYVPGHLQRYVLEPLIDDHEEDDTNNNARTSSSTAASTSSGPATKKAKLSSSQQPSGKSTTGSRRHSSGTSGQVSRDNTDAEDNQDTTVLSSSPGIVVGPDKTGGLASLELSSEFSLPGTATQAITTRLASIVGSTAPSTNSSAINKGNIPIPQVTNGVNRGTIETIVKTSIEQLGGYLTKDNDILPFEQISDMVESIRQNSSKAFTALSTVQSSATVTWITNLLESCGVYLQQDPSYQSLLNRINNETTLSSSSTAYTEDQQYCVELQTALALHVISLVAKGWQPTAAEIESYTATTQGTSTSKRNSRTTVSSSSSSSTSTDAASKRSQRRK